jgi:glutamate dehydrogenase
MDTTQPDQKLAAIATRVAAHAAREDAALLAALVAQTFLDVDPEDLASRSADAMAGALLSLWQLGRTRAAAEARLRVLSPTQDADGWASRHTVIQVVNDDMPFLVDSTGMEINRQGLTAHLTIHPVLAVQRDAQGRVTALASRREQPEWPRESWMHIEVDRQGDAAGRQRLAEGIGHVLDDVRAVTNDWPAMLAQLQGVVAEVEQDLRGLPNDGASADRRECLAFLHWLADGHMLLLGYRRHDLVHHEGEDALRLVPGSGLGVLRESGEEKLSPSFARLPQLARALARAPAPLVVMTKANARATIHRPGYVDYVGIKRLDGAGNVVGEHRFLGLLTSTAYSARVAEIPLLRGKVTAVAYGAGFAPDGHSGKALTHILETYPRDELFQISVEELRETALGILRLGERQRLRLFLRRDPFDRFISCLIYVPRENYGTDLRIRFQEILMRAFAGLSTDFDVLLTDAILARVHMTVRTTPGAVPAFDAKAVEAELTAAARRWDDELRDALIEAEGEARGMQLVRRWQRAFPAAFRERTGAQAAVADVRKLETLRRPGGEGNATAYALYRPLGAAGNRLGFKVYRAGAPVVLSLSLPMLEKLGLTVLTENPARLTPVESEPAWVHDFELELAGGPEIELEPVRPLFEDAFARVFDGLVENDEFNRLVLRANLSAEEIVILRAYAKYMRQTGFALSQSFIEATLATHPRIARQLVQLFKLRLEPATHEAGASEAQQQAIEAALEKVSNLSEDRVLRQYLALIRATLRTNYWRTNEKGERRSYLSFKFDPSQVPGLPEPRPMFEIFVYSTRFEGIHLRGGKVARGGLRWSDRPEDFRTEVLGLVKAQMVKNTVIVPVGSKGGFVLKKAPPTSEREAYMAEGVACYKDFLRGLLDLTDNLVGGKVVPPPQTVRHDGDDPYLVVAADKGTATFSDFANGVSAEYGHWLGDAFASGGSVGYDHKKMGITARGAWESVKRHFREMGIDTQSTDFTVVGIGDMSGDVFGNGMLLSPHIKLVAAFDHRHVFIDPRPDPAQSLAERQRLFNLPRSSWADYNAELISRGGGVWPRSAKSVPISPEARAVLGIESPAQAMTPAELIHAILKAPVDLLYNGGIGTYVKAADESHAQVGDRANDAIRVDGRELRCKVVAEGGNLGCTQLGRIEYAQVGADGSGGRINTDAIDNSAGVDTSDHEVNIKILLNLVQADGELTEKQRNKLLAEMTDEVASLVLRDNYFQSQALALTRRRSVQLLEQQQRFIRYLEKQGKLNRAIEYLPSDEEIDDRRTKGTGLTQPELAVLLAYSKIWLSDALIGSDLPEDPWIASALERYFPTPLRARYAAVMPRHPLKREIVATHVLNSMINRVGPTFVHRLMEATGASAPQVVRAYLLTRECFGFVPLWQAIESLDSKVPDAAQGEMLLELGQLTVRATSWFLRSRRLAGPIGATIEAFRPAVEALGQREAARLAGLSNEGGGGLSHALTKGWIEAGVPNDLARRVASSTALQAALDIVEIAEGAKQPIETVAELHTALGEKLNLPRLRQLVNRLPAEGYWQGLAKGALLDDLAAMQRALAASAMREATAGDASPLDAWARRNDGALERAQRLLSELAEARNVDLAMLSVALRELRNLM